MVIRAGIVLLLLVALTSAAHATFDEDGVMYVSPAGQANNAIGRSLALRADGKFHAAGISYVRGVSDEPTLEIRRFDADGHQDAAFSVSQLHLGSMSLSPRSLLVQRDDAVIVATTLANQASPSDSYTRIQRFLDDGGTDSSFSSFTFDPSMGADSLNVLAMQVDGKVLAAGYMPRINGGGYVGVVARLLPGGSLDHAFGDEGYVRIGDLVSSNFGLTYSDFFPASLNLLADGRIMLTGTVSDGFGAYSEMLFTRLLPDGSFDPDFNGGEPKLYAHRLGSNIGFINSANAADVSPEGVILVGGRTTAGGTGRACLLQFDPNGMLVAEACAGYGSHARLTDVQLLPNGGAVGVGSYLDGSLEENALMAIYDAGLQFSGQYSGRFTSADRAHNLAAMAFDPYQNRMISLGTGITMLSGQYSNRWAFASDALAADLDATPDPVTLGSPLEVHPGDQASAVFQLSGLDPFVRMPVRVSGGHLSSGGHEVAAGFTPPAALGFFTSSQHPALLNMTVSHMAPMALDETTVTTMEFGGVVRSNNLTLTVGPTETVLFSSVTRENPSSGELFADGFEDAPP